VPTNKKTCCQICPVRTKIGDMSPTLPAKLTSGNLAALLTWHRVPNVGELNKEEMLAKWGRIMTSLKPPPLYEKWTHEDEVKLEEAKSDIVEMAYTALGHMVVLKKKELLLAAWEMSQEEVDQLVVARSETAGSGGIWGGDGGVTGEQKIMGPRYSRGNAVP
jgi:hypothetical protein